MPGGTARKQRDAASAAGREIQDGAAHHPAGARAGRSVAAGTAQKLSMYARKAGGNQNEAADPPSPTVSPTQQPLTQEHTQEDIAIGAKTAQQQVCVIPAMEMQQGEEPTLRDVIAAISKCNSALAGLSVQVGSMQEQLSFMRHGIQKVNERTTAVEGRINYPRCGGTYSDMTNSLLSSCPSRTTWRTD